MGVGVLKYKKQLIYAGIIAIVIAAVFTYYYQAFYLFDKFLPGVKIASVTVSGHDAREATELVDEWLEVSHNTPIIFYSNDYSYESNLEELCPKPDVAQIVENAWKMEQQRGLKSKIMTMHGNKATVYPMKLMCDPNVIQTIVEELSANLNKDFQNARLEISKAEGLKIVPGVNGQKVDIDATFAGMPVKWSDFSVLRIPIVLKSTEPVVNEEQLNLMGELATFATWYNVNEVDRSHNLRLAANTINSSAIPPGEVFSFNQIVGERTYANGYRDALIINNGIFEPGLGGGICQVSSTIYNAVLLAGLEIAERHNHALAVSYVPLGHDATVAYGLQDFKFRNNTNYPIYVRAVAESGGLTVNIYGHLKYKKKISVTNIVDRVIEFEEIIEVKDDMEPGTEKIEQKGVTGYVARSFRHFYDNTDQVIKTELLATDYYRPANKIIFKGPSVEMPANGQPEGENELDDVLPNDSETESQSSIEEDNVPPAEEDD